MNTVNRCPKLILTTAEKYFFNVFSLMDVLQVGPEGAGHFVKMVHNGIEYGDMQLICEAYHLMQSLLGMSNSEMASVRSVYQLVLSKYIVQQ